MKGRGADRSVDFVRFAPVFGGQVLEIVALETILSTFPALTRESDHDPDGSQRVLQD
jgi:hypothetical protein